MRKFEEILKMMTWVKNAANLAFLCIWKIKTCHRCKKRQLLKKSTFREDSRTLLKIEENWGDLRRFEEAWQPFSNSPSMSNQWPVNTHIITTTDEVSNAEISAGVKRPQQPREILKSMQNTLIGYLPIFYFNDLCF